MYTAISGAERTSRGENGRGPGRQVAGSYNIWDKKRSSAFRACRIENRIPVVTAGTPIPPPSRNVPARANSLGFNVTKLSNAQVREGKNGAKLDGLTQQGRTALLANTPLWFYVLREAELANGKLKGAGARIVAETFHRAIEGRTPSIVRDPDWRPSLGPNNTTFRMVDLLLFAFQRKKNLLAPLG